MFHSREALWFNFTKHLRQKDTYRDRILKYDKKISVKCLYNIEQGFPTQTESEYHEAFLIFKKGKNSLNFHLKQTIQKNV